MGTWRDRLSMHLDRQEISRAELARRLTKAGVSTSRSAVTKWLNEGQDPGVETFAAICRLTGQSADALLGVAKGSTVAVHVADLSLAVKGLSETVAVLADYLPPPATEPEDEPAVAAQVVPRADAIKQRNPATPDNGRNGSTRAKGRG